ncbi:MAG: YcgN family cysteine cluster protein [Brevefilum sp.]
MEPFWKTKKLDEMTVEEWESLCDCCGKCCLHKFDDPTGRKVLFTNVACRLLDLNTCLCSDYEHRTQLVSDCSILTPHKAHVLDWLPDTCAYRLLVQGKDLPWWHPLVSGKRSTVREAGISICNRAISEDTIDLSDLADYVVDYLK